MLESITDTNRLNFNQSSICDDSLALALFVQNAYEHIKSIRVLPHPNTLRITSQHLGSSSKAFAKIFTNYEAASAKWSTSK